MGEENKAILIGYIPNDMATYYRCPKCMWVFTNWDVGRQKEEKHCPRCMTVLGGLDEH